MNLLVELEAQVRAYLEKHLSLEALDDWLADHAQAIANSDDQQVRRLAGRAWNLIAELGIGDGSEDHVCSGLAAVAAQSLPT